ncbi:MAG: hypothetical protein CMQ49_01560 [Gammaproteobacteria bacterium]|nr:hypothetical protein [Gammaproteobacteria bacterium]|tara:strand:- start:3147 stop:3596 length:450 start_codon:yes stop_codon:yes gene_type:complete
MKIVVGVLIALLVFVAGYILYLRLVTNPAVIDELRANPQGARSERVMLLTLPGGKELPVNYLREQDLVYVGIDGLWWRQFRAGAQPVRLLIKGEDLTGRARAVLDDPAYTEDVFSRLRPTAPTWLPGRMRGVLLEIVLDTGPGLADQDT